MSERRRSKSIKIGYWVLAVAVVGGLHRYYVAASRAEANRIVTRFSNSKSSTVNTLRIWKRPVSRWGKAADAGNLLLSNVREGALAGISWPPAFFDE
jgi:hypothetical protein